MRNEYWRWSRPPLGKKQRVLRNSSPVTRLLAYWPSRLKVLAAMRPAIRLTCVVAYASLIIGLALAGLKAYAPLYLQNLRRYKCIIIISSSIIIIIIIIIIMSSQQRTWFTHTILSLLCFHSQVYNPLSVLSKAKHSVLSLAITSVMLAI